MPTDRLNRVPTVLLGIVVPLVALVTVVVTLNATTDGTSAAVGDRCSKLPGSNRWISDVAWSICPSKRGTSALCTLESSSAVYQAA